MSSPRSAAFSATRPEGARVAPPRSSPAELLAKRCEPVGNFRALEEAVGARLSRCVPQLARAADGRVFTGRQALGLKLVDRLGNEKTALEWLEKEKGIDSKTRITDWKLRSRFGDFSFLHMAAIGVLDWIGLDSLARRVEESAIVQTIERLNLDGLLALWHPSAND